ncbi:Uncharacterized protein TCM_042169 [Theobroma cacao]|uniref:Uncharacterized protein n=1 Tax=Theobroma cacao TaxID=3641 RepID=A0A061H0C1_THECC|nr:Uncharacterized protein TCM_042169 [Theobroma cacao]
MVYHVTDFVYICHDLRTVFRNVCCILIGSKIYIVGGCCEVLKANRSYWEVLPQPSEPLWNGQRCDATVKGSCVVGDSKTIVHAKPFPTILFVYDVNHNTWNKVELPDNNLPSNVLFNYCLNVVDTCFFFDKNWNFYFLSTGAIEPSVSFSHPTAFDW